MYVLNHIILTIYYSYHNLMWDFNQMYIQKLVLIILSCGHWAVWKSKINYSPKPLVS